MQNLFVISYNASQVAKRAFVLVRIMKAGVHPSPFTITAQLSKPGYVAVSSIIQLENGSRP